MRMGRPAKLALEPLPAASLVNVDGFAPLLTLSTLSRAFVRSLPSPRVALKAEPRREPERNPSSPLSRTPTPPTYVSGSVSTSPVKPTTASSQRLSPAPSALPCFCHTSPMPMEPSWLPSNQASGFVWSIQSCGLNPSPANKSPTSLIVDAIARCGTPSMSSGWSRLLTTGLLIRVPRPLPNPVLKNDSARPPPSSSLSPPPIPFALCALARIA